MKLLQVVRLGFASFMLIGHIASLSAMPGLRANDDEEEAPSVAPLIAQTTPAPTQNAGPAPAANKPAVPNRFIESLSSEGPNTVGQDDTKIGTNGNWVKKKDFLMRSFELQKEIETLATKIQGHRNIYQQKFNTIDQGFESFYKQLGFEQGKVDELFTQLEEYLEQKKQRRIARVKRDVLEEREQQMALEQLEETLKKNKELLVQFKNDMKSIDELDKSVGTRVQQADTQINAALKEAARSKDVLQSMWGMLDDKLAKAAYYELKDGILGRLKTIDTYLETTLAGDLDSVGTNITTQIQKALESIKGLEAQGLLIHDRKKRVEERTMQKGKEALAQIEQDKHVQQQAKSKINKGFFAKMYDSTVNFVASIYRFFANLFGYGEPAVRARVRRPVAESAPAPASAMPQATTPTIPVVPPVVPAAQPMPQAVVPVQPAAPIVPIA